MTCGDLFAGIGGMSLGMERAGFQIVWQVEREPYCENVLARHWPDVQRRRDVRFAGAATLQPVDLVAGGFPCQDISAAGRGAGLAGYRSGLWREFARILRELRPRWVLVENVPALRRRGADTVLSDLEAAGYACWPLVVGARHVGAPHRRDRVWIVGRQRVLVDGDAAGLEGRSLPRCQRAHQWPARPGSPADTGMGDPSDDGIRDEQLSRRSDASASFPARPGDQQHAWEAPRTVESPLGRAVDGPTDWLATVVNDGTHSDPESHEDVCTLWACLSPESFQRAAGRSGMLLTPSLLFAYVLSHVAREGFLSEGDLVQTFATASPEKRLRELWLIAQAGDPSREPQSPEHGFLEPTDALQAMSRRVALDAAESWARHQRQEASGAAHGISARLAGTRWKHELRALGNAVVPQVVEMIGRAILAVEKELGR